MDKISFVLTLKINANPLGSDLERVKKILLPSFIKYFDLTQIDVFWVVVPADELKQVKEQLKGFPESLKLTVLNEEKILEFVPGWERERIAHGLLRILGKLEHKFTGKEHVYKYLKPREGWHTLGGWWKQQLLKILAARMIKTSYYMIVDADLCLVRPADLKALFPDGKAVYGRNKLKSKYDWWVGSARVLDVPLELKEEEEVISVTPQILATSVVRHLKDYLMLKSKEKGAKTLFEYLAKNSFWTEYTLYWLFLLRFYKKDDYYNDLPQGYALHSKCSTWFRDQAPDVQALRQRIDLAFRQDNAIFLVVQSACIPLSEYYEAIKGHLS